MFTSEPLTQPLNVVGMLMADLYVSTSAVDTDFVARHSDVGPEGYAQRLNAGIVRLRYREGYEQIKLVQPGEVVKVEVDIPKFVDAWPESRWAYRQAENKTCQARWT